MLIDHLENLSKNPKVLLGVFLFLFVLRLYQFTGPIVDHHSWNQISSASMAKHLFYDWKTFFAPTVDQYPSLRSESTVYAQEMPLYHIPIALLYHVVGVSEWPGRLISIVYGILGLWFWYLLVKHLLGSPIALLTIVIAGISPLSWYYHRTIMTDNSMVTAMIAGFYYFYLWLEDHKQNRYFWYSLIWTIAAGLFKTYGLVIGVAYLILILFKKEYQLFLSPKLYLFAVLAWLPSLAWIYHVLSFETGRSEFSNVNQILHPGLLTDWDFYNRMIFSRLIDQLLTPWMAIFAIVGIFCLKRNKKEHQPIIAWSIGCVAYLAMVQRGNFVHDYYQLMFVPGLAALAALGIVRFLQWEAYSNTLRQTVFIGCLALFLIQSTIYTYNHMRYDIGSYNVGKKISELSTSPQDKVLAWDIGAGKHNQLVYYSNRKGWHIKKLDLGQLEKFREQGALWLGVNLLLETHYPKFQSVLQEIEAIYPKVWEDTSSKDRYGRTVISQVFSLIPENKK